MSVLGVGTFQFAKSAQTDHDQCQQYCEMTHRILWVNSPTGYGFYKDSQKS